MSNETQERIANLLKSELILEEAIREVSEALRLIRVELLLLQRQARVEEASQRRAKPDSR